MRFCLVVFLSVSLRTALASGLLISDDDISDDLVATDDDISVTIGSSPDEFRKCIKTARAVLCDYDAGNVPKRVNDHDVNDTFIITVDEHEVCAERTDKAHGWGMELELKCQTAMTPSHNVIVTIGHSEDQVKCVEQPHEVFKCDDDAGHPGKRVNAHANGDTFEITVGKGQICARRTDKDHGWGMHLAIMCDKVSWIRRDPYKKIFYTGIFGMILCCLTITYLVVRRKYKEAFRRELPPMNSGASLQPMHPDEREARRQRSFEPVSC